MATFSGTLFSSSMAVFFFSCILFLSHSEASRELLVGGKSDSWKIPSSDSDSLNRWAQNSRFIVGDSLVWKYDGTKDSVLQVNKRDYVTCNTSSPIAEYSDGNTKVKLENSGPYHFISGAEDHCKQGQKMIVVVLSEKHGGGRHSAGIPSPAPSPAEKQFQAPALAPTSGASILNGSCFLLMLAAGIFLLGLF